MVDSGFGQLPTNLSVEYVLFLTFDIMFEILYSYTGFVCPGFIMTVPGLHECKDQISVHALDFLITYFILAVDWKTPWLSCPYGKIIQNSTRFLSRTHDIPGLVKGMTVCLCKYWENDHLSCFEYPACLLFIFIFFGPLCWNKAAYDVVFSTNLLR